MDQPSDRDSQLRQFLEFAVPDQVDNLLQIFAQKGLDFEALQFLDLRVLGVGERIQRLLSSALNQWLSPYAATAVTGPRRETSPAGIGSPSGGAEAVVFDDRSPQESPTSNEQAGDHGPVAPAYYQDSFVAQPHAAFPSLLRPVTNNSPPFDAVSQPGPAYPDMRGRHFQNASAARLPLPQGSGGPRLQAQSLEEARLHAQAQVLANAQLQLQYQAEQLRRNRRPSLGSSRSSPPYPFYSAQNSQPAPKPPALGFWMCQSCFSANLPMSTNCATCHLSRSAPSLSGALQALSIGGGVGGLNSPPAPAATPSYPPGPTYEQLQRRAIQNGESPVKIFVGGLASDTTKSDMQKYFSQFGSVNSIIFTAPQSSASLHKGFGFVVFDHPESVDRVFEMGVFHMVKGKEVEVKRALAIDHPLIAKSHRNQRSYPNPRSPLMGQMLSVPSPGASFPSSAEASPLALSRSVAVRRPPQYNKLQPGEPEPGMPPYGQSLGEPEPDTIWIDNSARARYP